MKIRRRCVVTVCIFTLSAIFVVTGSNVAHAAPKLQCGFNREYGEASISPIKNGKVLGKRVWTRTLIESDRRVTVKKLKNRRKVLSSSTVKKLQERLGTLKILFNRVKKCPQDVPPITYSEVAPIIERSCMGCHRTQGEWENSQEWMLSSGRVSAGDPRGSILYTYLSGNPEGYSPGYMPQGLPALSASEISILKGWILHLGEGISGPKKVDYSCNENQAISVTPLMRLAKVELINSLNDFASVLSPTEQQEVQSAIEPALQLIPEDLAQRAFLQEQVFAKLDDRLQQEHLDGYYAVASSFAAAVTLSTERMTSFSRHNCTPGASGAALSCLRAFIADFGRSVYRRPLTTNERLALETFFLARPSGSAVADLITRMLLSPHFLYHIEAEGVSIGVSDATYELSPYELASRLSFLFWQTTPSVALLDAASDGSLVSSTQQIVDAHFFSGPGLARTQATVEDFFIDWMGLERIPVINAAETAAFEAFASGETLVAGGAVLRTDAEEEILTMVDHHTWHSDSNLSELLLSNNSYSTSAPLSHLYGAPPRGGSAPQPLPAPNRPGILVRAATLISGTHTTNPAKRGARVLRDFLCEELPDPDPALMGLIIPPPYDPSRTTRQRFTDTAASPACVGCHNRINPIGFALENYDALGRYRTEETLYAESGAVDGVLPIDAKTGAVLFAGQVTPVNGGEDLIKVMVESGRVHSCVAKKYFEFAFRRHPGYQGDDGCTLEGLRHAAVTGSLRDFFKSIIEQPSFRRRRQGS